MPHWLVVGQHDTRLLDELLAGKTVQANYADAWEAALQERLPQTIMVDGNAPPLVFASLLVYGRDCEVDLGCCATQSGNWLEWVLLFDHIYLFGMVADAVIAKFSGFPLLFDVDWDRVAQHNRDPLACTRIVHDRQTRRWSAEYLACVPRVWSCQEHWRFPKDERERIYWLLLGRRSPQSCLRMLDASLLHRIIEHVMFLAR